MYLCLMYVCPDVSNSGGGDVPTSDVSKSAPSSCLSVLVPCALVPFEQQETTPLPVHSMQETYSLYSYKVAFERS